MKFTEILKSIALQSGVSETEITAVLENASVASIEIDDAVSTKLTAPRLSMDAAKNNPDLKKHFRAIVLNGVDAEIERSMAEMSLDTDSINEIKGLESTEKRIKAFAAKVQTLEASKAGKSAPDIEKLNKKIEELNASIVTERDTAQRQLAEKDLSLENERIGWEVNSILSNYEYVAPVEKDINISIARSLTDKALAEKGLKIVKKDKSLILQTAEGTEYFDNNVKVGLSDFVSKTLANSKVIKASNSTGKADQRQTTTTNTSIVEGNPIKNAEEVMSQLNAG